MPKRRSRDHLAVSLFPFLSILACVIGVLTLMITALALGQISTGAADQAEMDRAKEYQKLLAAIREDEASARRIEERIAGMTGAEAEADRLREERRVLEEKRKAAAMPPVPAEKLREQAEATKRRNDEAEKELKSLREQMGPLRTEAARLKPADDAGRVTIRPGGTGTNLKPIFIECGPAGVVLHEPPTPTVIPLANVATHEALLKQLDAVADSTDRTVIFLVRPAGIATYNHARAIAIARFARNGKLAVPGEGPLDLSLFRLKQD